MVCVLSQQRASKTTERSMNEHLICCTHVLECNIPSTPENYPDLICEECSIELCKTNAVVPEEVHLVCKCCIKKSAKNK